MLRMYSFVSRLFSFLFVCSIVSVACAQSFYVGLTDGNILLVHSDGTSAPFGSVTHPEGMVVDELGNLFVADSTDNVIYKFSQTGTRTVFASGLSGVSDVALDSAGNLYAADTNNNQVVRFDSNGASLGVYGTGVAGPEALTFDQDDVLFVASSTNSNIVQFPPGGGSPTIFAPVTPSVVTVTFDSDFTHLYEGGSNSGTIMMFDRAGTASTYPKAVGGTSDMTFDLDGNFYVLDSQTKTIQKFAPDTSQTTFATLNTTSTPSGFVFILPNRDQIIGQGSIAASSGKANFRITVRKTKSGRREGGFSYNDPAAHIDFSATKFSSINILGNDAQFSGNAKLGKKHISFTVDVNDYGNLGVPDSFSIKLSTGYSASGDLTSGNIVISGK
ncbi:MAG: hypothetical protein QOI34_848 [Verrucomicrobiota bacterium]